MLVSAKLRILSQMGGERPYRPMGQHEARRLLAEEHASPFSNARLGGLAAL